MALNFFVTRLDGKDSAFMTSAESAEEAQDELGRAGSDEEKIVSFFSVDGEAAEAIAAVACVNVEQDGSIGQTLETLITVAFNAGKSCKD